MDETLLNQAHQEWEDFLGTLSHEEKKSTESLLEAVESNSLHYLALAKNYVKFDQTVNRLEAKYLYDEEIIPTIYSCYFERGLHELAFDYLIKAIKYFEERNLNIPNVIADLREKYTDEQTIQKLKLVLGNLPSQRANDIPKILPSNLNGKKFLSEFILTELIQAAKVMLEKKEAIRQVTHENRFNDFLLAILRLRLPIWGWAIQDQSRVGISSGGKDAGETDLLIQASGNTIALCEALILKDKAYTESHILKCGNYIRTLERYYIVVYCLGEKTDFEAKWANYKNDVSSIAYPPDFAINEAEGFEDLSFKFTDVRNFKIAKTKHSEKIELFHVMINLGD